FIFPIKLVIIVRRSTLNRGPRILKGLLSMYATSKTYNIRIWVCQMNEADSQRLASELERFGLAYTDDADSADVIVLNTCVVRQSAEDRVYGRLGQLKVLKEQHPGKIVGLMGCLVGVRDDLPLRRRFPFVDVFLPPSEPAPMVSFLEDRGLEQEIVEQQAGELARRYALQDGDVIIPQHERGQLDRKSVV